MVRKRKLKAAVERHDPLPRCNGPKLKYFGHGGEQFKLVGLLSLRNPGRHGHVFEAVLDSQHYALKVFNFYDVAEAAGLAGRNIPEQMIVDHMDPFYAECRAYGRMEERECNGVVAVRCHGFTSVPADREREISEAFDIMDWNRPSDEYDRSISERQPLRAIVKDLRREEICFTKTMVRRMKADLFKLRKILVFVRDIRSDNYLGGKLLDFSVAWTEPHLMLSTDVQSQAAIDIEVTSELHEFDEMVREEGINSKVRAVPAGTGQNIDQLRRSKRIRVNPQRYTDPPRETQVARINRRKHHKSKAKA